MTTPFSRLLWVLLASNAILVGCAQTSASSGASAGPVALSACVGSANAQCYGGPP